MKGGGGIGIAGDGESRTTSGRPYPPGIHPGDVDSSASTSSKLPPTLRLSLPPPWSRGGVKRLRDTGRGRGVSTSRCTVHPP
ncbi:hypothetical protein EYF80_059782 [Liparis tanakae]|uniref:Uncharacterized protein n=1 Tax=Liparis tanakae TaxID=230148 RepID=A0A4Z2EMR1_9TELE|nr:hypothetical protein EYF80_059782 [Liparis tanakae]